MDNLTPEMITWLIYFAGLFIGSVAMGYSDDEHPGSVILLALWPLLIAAALGVVVLGAPYVLGKFLRELTFRKEPTNG